MEKHQLSSMMVGILSLTIVLALGINNACALVDEDDKRNL